VREQYAGLCRRLHGHFNYFGVNGNMPALRQVYWQATQKWVKWLRRRSQRSRPWEHFRRLLDHFPLPTPRIRVRIWGNEASHFHGRAGWWKSPKAPVKTGVV
jgi:hypothetical protein